MLSMDKPLDDAMGQVLYSLFHLPAETCRRVLDEDTESARLLRPLIEYRLSFPPLDPIAGEPTTTT